MSHEQVFFSFSLYGSNKKYTEGMIVNARQISERFPTAITQIYIADDVPADIVARLLSVSNVRLIHVQRAVDQQNTFNRFLAIDDPDCDIMFSRDADSRIHDRDAACIEDFIASDKILHIIRDHPYHGTRIMAGMWGIRKSAFTQPSSSVAKALAEPQIPNASVAVAATRDVCVALRGCAGRLIRQHGRHAAAANAITEKETPNASVAVATKAVAEQSMQNLIQQWMTHANTDTGYGCDQRFLEHVIYPAFVRNAIIHDRHRFFNEPVYLPFRVSIIDRLFVGQVHLFNEAGEEYTQFNVDSL
jgi:hypothetical protein